MISNTNDLFGNYDYGNLTVTTGGAGTYSNSPYIYTTTGTDTITLSDYNWTTANVMAPLHVNGDAVIEGELTVGGVKLSERLDKIEERLGILHPNEQLEEKWEKLRSLRNMYMELEKEIIEKEEVWKILKK